MFDKLNKIEFEPYYNYSLADGRWLQWAKQEYDTHWECAPEHIKNIEVIFTVVGHSYLPADRVFGNIEKGIKKLEVVTQPETYIERFSKNGSVSHLKQNCNVFNWKEHISDVLKPTGTWHFSFKDTKRFLLKKCKTGNVLIRGEYKSVLRKGKSPHMIKSATIKSGLQQANILKLKDIDKLLTKHIGATWKSLEELSLYATIFCNKILEPEQPGQEVENALCERNSRSNLRIY